MDRNICTIVKYCFLGIIASLVAKNALSRDLDKTFEDLFNLVLIERLRLSPSFHASHFIPAAEQANQDLTPALNSLIANKVSSFPLSSTSIGVTFDFSTGDPVKITDSLGPIFAENAQTLGQGKFNIGFNHTFLTLDQFRGLDTKDIRFTFAHVDIPPPFSEPGLGDDLSESDTIDLILDLDIDSTISAFHGTYGITDNLDIGIAIPLVYVEIDGKAEATIDSFTFDQTGNPLHSFGLPTPEDANLTTTESYGDDAFGIGDIALRLKYSFLQDFDINLAMLVDLRLPTGDEDNFLGTGETNIKITEVFSKNFGDTTAHINASYERRGGDDDSDEIEYVFGFDHKLSDSITLAIDIIGNFDLNEDEAINLSPGTATIVDQVDTDDDGTPDVSNTRIVDLSNVPEDDEDNEIDLSLGFRYSPSYRYSLLANIIVPLNDDGLRSEVTPTFGFNMNF